MADLDTLRPEVRDALWHLRPANRARFQMKSWETIRTELLRLADENAKLASWQCPFLDGSGLTGDDHGHQYCRKDAELSEMKQSFDLRWNADMRAIEQWRTAHPGKDLVMPDHADLCVWLMDELVALRELHKVTCESAAANAGELAALMARIAEASRVALGTYPAHGSGYVQIVTEPKEGDKTYRLLVDEPAPTSEQGSLDELRIERGGSSHG